MSGMELENTEAISSVFVPGGPFLERPGHF